MRGYNFDMSKKAPARPTVSEESLIAVFSLLGRRWIGRVLAALMEGPMRFAELRRAVSGISESMLSQRLGELIDAGLVHREIIEGPPLGASYRLTESGMALRPALQELMRWSGVYLGSPCDPSSVQKRVQPRTGPALLG
jgi:DNA-binding HxlR family transcriptional regulator